MCNADSDDEKDHKKNGSRHRPRVSRKDGSQEYLNWPVNDVDAVRDPTKVPKKTIFEKLLKVVLLGNADNEDRSEKIYHAITPEELPILQKE